jgi:anti-anti-sigma factor
VTQAHAFGVAVEHRGQLVRLTPRGDLDLATVPILEREFTVVSHTQAIVIEIDLRQLSFLDSAAIHLLIRMDCACLGEDRLRLISGAPHVDRILTIAGVRDGLPIAQSAPPTAQI